MPLFPWSGALQPPPIHVLTEKRWSQQRGQRGGGGGGGGGLGVETRLCARAAQKRGTKMCHQFSDGVVQFAGYSLSWMKFCCKLEIWKCRSSRISRVI